MRHLLEVRRHVRVVPREMHVVEHQADDVLYPIAETAGGRRRRPRRVRCGLRLLTGHDRARADQDSDSDRSRTAHRMGKTP